MSDDVRPGPDEDVSRLHVPVDESLGVGGIQRCGNLGQHAESALEPQRARLLEDLAEVDAVDVPHRDVVHAVGVVRLVDRDHVRVIDPRGHQRLAYETLPEALVLRKFRRQQLEGDLPPKMEVLRAVDHPHAAAADVALDPVRAELRSELDLHHRCEPFVAGGLPAAGFDVPPS